MDMENESNVVDLSKKDQMILDFMREQLKESFPGLNLGDRSAFMETFGATHIALHRPIFETADRFMLKQTLDQAANMTEEEMDQLGMRYGKRRLEGTIANGIATFIFNDIPKEGFIIIPANYQVSSTRNQTFSVNTTMTLNEVQLGQYFDADEFIYRVPVPVTSVNATVEANINAGELQVGITPLPNLTRIDNEAPFRGGRDRETNVEFAERLEREGYADTFGVDAGYTAFARGIKGVEEVVVAGYGHPLMKRDIIGEYAINTNFTQTVKDVHFGTKIDLYVRGRDLETAIETLPVIELPEGGLGFVLTVKPVYDIIQVRYYLYEGQLINPEVNQAETYVSAYVLDKEEDSETEGTLDERVYVRLFDDRVTTDHRVEVQYRYNRTIQNLQEELYGYNRRPPTADVKPKEAIGKYVYGSMTVRPYGTMSLTMRDRYVVQDRMKDLFRKQLIGTSLQFSDIQSSITDKSAWDEAMTMSVIDSIRIPATTFFVAKNPSSYAYYTLGQKQRAFLEQVRIKQPFINRLLSTYRDTMKTYDYFDVLQAMFMDDDFAQRMRELEADGDVTSRSITFLREMKRGFDESLAVKFLLPNELPAGLNEFFEYGDIFLHEDRPYQMEDWRRVLATLLRIAQFDEKEPDYTILLDLLGMVLLLSFVYGKRDDIEGREDELYAFLGRAFEHTTYRGYIAQREEGN